jgi:hypothetical protein
MKIVKILLKILMNNSVTKSNNLQTRCGYIYQIDISQILLTPAVKTYLSNKLISKDFASYFFNPKSTECGNLTRMERLESLSNEDFIQLCNNNPIDVSSVMMEYKDKETGDIEASSFYVIDNGRHRVASAIARGMGKINANVIF